MAIPKVFISSTCYDLEEERTQLERFVNSYGFQPILSEYSDVFYDPDEHTHESCVKEVVHCDIFILIISGRFGGRYVSGSGESITQAEYNEARKLNIPIFAFVKSDVLQAQLYYKENIKSEGKDFAKKIHYPSIKKQSDAIPIFTFIQSVQQAKDNNAIESYNSFSDIEIHLRKQWAGLFFSFLQKRKQQFDVEHISSILEKLSGSSAKLESLVESIHSNNQGEEKTKELIIRTEVKQATESFFYVVAEMLTDLIEEVVNFKVTPSQINKAAKVDPNTFDNIIEYINALNLLNLSKWEEGEVHVTHSSSQFGLIFSKDDSNLKILEDSFVLGVNNSDSDLRKEILFSTLNRWIK